MHTSTMLRMKCFLDNYGFDGAKVLDVGSYDVNGSYRSLFVNYNMSYTGLDIVRGPGVDIVMDAPYSWDSIPDESFDIIISGQAFEHIEYPWLSIKEIYKKIKNGGIICITAPNSTPEHRYPTDCYRYFSDGLKAIVESAGFSVLEVCVSGIPERSASTEWDAIDNDAYIIASKGEYSGEKKVLFPFERRINRSDDIYGEYRLLSYWLSDGHNKEKLLNLIKESGYKRIFITSHRNDDDENYFKNIVLSDMKAYSKNTSLEVEEIIFDYRDESFSVDEDALVVICSIDYHRDFIKYLRKTYDGIKVDYLDNLIFFDEVKDFTAKYKQVYIYGAGKHGKLMAYQLDSLNCNVPGFVVSDGRREEQIVCDKRVYELSEIELNDETGIIIAVKDDIKYEMEKELIKRGIKNYILYYYK